MNYKHLHYFWVVAKTGSIINASEALHITPQTISGQLTLLEDSVGGKLFVRKNRKLRLSNLGRVAFKYADEIFSLGEELEDVLGNAESLQQGQFYAGIMDGIPKTIAYKILAPVIEEKQNKLVCQEGSFDQLIAKLAVRDLDCVISDMPVSSAYSIRAYNHKLGDSPMTCFAAKKATRKKLPEFPDLLSESPVLLPTTNSTIRPAIDQWFMSEKISPHIIGEFDDSALLKAFGQAGDGVFFMPSVIETEVVEHYGVSIVGRTKKIREQFFAITLDKHLSRGNPVLQKIYDSAIENVFIQ